MPRMIYEAAPRSFGVACHEVWCRLQFLLPDGLRACNCHDWDDAGICPTQEQLYFQSAVETWMWAWGCLYHAWRCEYVSHGGSRCEGVNGHTNNHAGRAQGRWWQEKLLAENA